MKPLSAAKRKELRGEILKLIYLNQEKQSSRLTDVTLWGVLSDLHYDVGRNLVRSLLQDLADRQCVRYQQEKDADTGKIAIRQIEILPRGRDIVDGIVAEPAIEVR